MIEKICGYSKEKKILKKYAFLPPPTGTLPLIQNLIQDDFVFNDE